MAPETKLRFNLSYKFLCATFEAKTNTQIMLPVALRLRQNRVCTGVYQYKY